ncbi:MAG: hypothetical protein WC238_05435 [Parcubacteria group bacterium]|jgi:hypothetical protein
MKNKNYKGSVLVFSLIMLSLILTSALAIGAATVIARKSSLTSNKSTQGFQVADSAVELAMHQILNNGTQIDLDRLATKMGAAPCDDGIISGSVVDSTKTYELSFRDNTATTDPINNCAGLVSTIGRIKSVGTFGSTARAVEAPVARAKDTLGFYDDAGKFYLRNINSSGTWSAGDDSYTFGGQSNAMPVTGNWDGDADGKAKIGVYDGDTGNWYLDYDGNGAYGGIDKSYTFGGQSNAMPVTGNWDGDADGKAKIGVYVGGTWYLDTDGSGGWNGGDYLYTFGNQPNAKAVAGDWDGDGTTEIGVYDSDTGEWYLDTSGDGIWNASEDDLYNFGSQPGAIPVTGDWDGDGTTEIGVYDSDDGKWYLDYDGDGTWDDKPTDRTFIYDGDNGLPIIGNWDGS